MRVAAVVLVAAISACAGYVGSDLPTRVLPDRGADRVAATARGLFERGDAVAALALLQEQTAAGVLSVDAQRLRQDVLRQRGRLGLLRAEAAARVAADPADPNAHYLLGRVLSAGEPQRAAFRRAAALGPESLWPWLGLAYALRTDSPAESLTVYARLYEASDHAPVVGVAFASALRSNGRLAEARAVYQRMVDSSGVGESELAAAAPGIGQLGLAQTLFAMGGNDRPAGWVALRTALAARPFDPGVQAILGELLRAGLPDEQVDQCLDVLRSRPQRMRDFARGGGEVLAQLLLRSRQPHAALAVLREAAVGPHQPDLRRLQRRLLLAVGDVGACLELLANDLPADLLADEANQVRSLWRTLLDGPWMHRDVLGEPLASDLVAAFRDVGLLDEAEAVAEVARRRQGHDDARLIAVRDEVRAELAFEGELRRLLYEGYVRTNIESLDQVLARIRAVSLEILGRDVVGDDHRFQVPLVGEMLDPFAAGLCQHLARYNHHLALGHRAGGVVEALLMTRLSVTDLPASATLALPGRCREVIGIDRSVRSLSGVLGGDLAGVALLNHCVIDHDAVAEWADAIARRRRIAAEDGNALLTDALPSDLDLYEPIDVNWRIAALSSLQDTELDAAVLEVIRLHERRHLVDAFHYLPFEANVWRGLGLLLRFGLSPSAIEGEMERRAELAALAYAAHPEIVLAHVAEFLGDGDVSSPHVRGFGQLARDLVAALQAEGLPPADAMVARWHRLDRTVVRRAAQRLLAELP